MLIIGGREAAQLKSYEAQTKGTTSIVTIKLEISNSTELWHVLRELEDTKAQQAIARQAAARQAAPRKAPARQRLEHAPLLALPPPDQSEPLE